MSMPGCAPYDERTALDEARAPGEARAWVVTPFGPVAGGVGVDVVVRDDADVTRDRVAMPLAETDSCALRAPLPTAP
jgi:hypothetical protein